MIVRDAVESDRMRVIALLRDSHAAAGFNRLDGPTGFFCPFEPAYAARLFAIHNNNDNARCLVLDVDGRAEGVLMAGAAEHPFGPVRLARETVWWIDPEHRGKSAPRMLDVYEDWARRAGCQFSGMVGMGKDPEVGRLYRRQGYGPAETHFLKVL